MDRAKIRFYFDENVEVIVAEQLNMRGIEAITTRDLGLLHADDEYHLNNATQMGYVLCTYDSDYLKLASSGIEHSGIIFGRWMKHGIGDWIHRLTQIYDNLSPDDMKNRIEYV